MTCRLSSDLVTVRTCYRHLAGELGMSIVSALIERGYITVYEKGNSIEYDLSDHGKEWSKKLGIGSPNRIKINACMDYSHQNPHISGAWSVDFCMFLFNQKYIMRNDKERSVTVTPRGKSFFRNQLAIEWAS